MKAKRRVSVYMAFNYNYKRTRANCFHRIIEDQGNSADSLSRALTTPLALDTSSSFSAEVSFMARHGNKFIDFLVNEDILNKKLDILFIYILEK